MTRGLGSLQRHILTALQERAASDCYLANGTAELAGSGPVIQARWRWYTLELLGLVDDTATEAQRHTANQAISTLARRGHVRTRLTDYPYHGPFGGYDAGGGEMAGQVDLAELRFLDSRWPARHGRRIWFQLPPPCNIPADDQLAVLRRLHVNRPDEFEDFAASVDRHHAWRSPIGHLVAWLLCGSPSKGSAPTLRVSH
ncbi:hypothetical protein [Mycobacterium paraterrae]|uniref:Uncharacterized protein n=1 Tax=Mycobacterium paraterrae TaxID=577492 RepID=A0ABY3VKU4_9MYCO|nr:hypothetical protein [Mycobacterium paraterrae]UMB70035.1 hypothetical protein MKK62_01360 [Mycobacterium paraterrae]